MTATQEWIIPNVLRAESLCLLPDECLKLVAETSTDIFIFWVNKYINLNSNSSDIAVKNMAKKLEDCYNSVNSLKTFLTSAESLEIARELNSLNFSDLGYSIDILKLQHYKAIIDCLFEDQRIIASTKCLNTEYLDLVIEDMKETSKLYGVESICYVHSFCDWMDKHRSMFRNAPFRRSSATPFKGVLFKKEQLGLLKYCIEFLISKKSSGANPNSWRFL